MKYNFVGFLFLLLFGFLAGCADPGSKNSFNAIVTFPVNQACYNYVLELSVESTVFDAKFKPFAVKLDAFPQISGFMELRSNSIMNVELQNEAIKLMNKCFARAKSTISVSTPESWVEVGREVQSNTANGVPIHSIVLNGSQIEIYYNWDDKNKSR